MGLERLIRSRLCRVTLLASALGYAAIPAAAGARAGAHAAAAKTKTKTCAQGGPCSTSLSSAPPPAPVTSPGGSGGGGGGGGGVGGSPPPPPAAAYSTFNVDAKARAKRRIKSGKLVEALDAGHKLVCPGYTRRDKSWFEFMLATKTQIGITYQITDTIHNSTPSGVHFCAGLGYRFKTLSGKPAHRAKLPDGKRGWVGLLPNCATDATTGAVTSTGPCVVSIKQSGSADSPSTTLIVRIPAMSLTDPWGAG